MSFGQAIASGFSNYATWKGRANRAEYWYWYLFTVIVTLPFNIVYNIVVQSQLRPAIEAKDWGAITSIMFGWSFWLLVVIALVLLLPSLAMLIRRLHDTDRTSGWVWLVLVPSAGGIILLVFSLLPGTPGKNRFDA